MRCYQSLREEYLQFFFRGSLSSLVAKPFDNGSQPPIAYLSKVNAASQGYWTMHKCFGAHKTNCPNLVFVISRTESTVHRYAISTYKSTFLLGIPCAY